MDNSKVYKQGTVEVKSILGNHQGVLLVYPFFSCLSIGEVVDKNLGRHHFVIIGTSLGSSQARS